MIMRVCFLILNSHMRAFIGTLVAAYGGGLEKWFFNTLGGADLGGGPRGYPLF